ncbi:MAG: class I SAM-dependent methyltransferase, partial [Acidimicrobiia bacterium]|nr:class I SAM-dependent methyltransferase [Acidimicrobiia bacterium]
AQVAATLGDFADVDVADGPPGGFAVVLVAFNTLFNLADADAQRRCLANVAERLAPGGSLLVEAFVPEPEHVVGGGAVTPTTIEADRVVLQVTQQDPTAQTVTGSIVTITEAGIRLRPWRIRYAPPEELDAMATEAGLRRADRWADWRRAPFSEDSPRHVTRYERASR